MSNSDGDGDGNSYVSIGAFNQYRANNSALCQSYRDHVNTKIDGVEDMVNASKTSMQWTIGICVSVSTILLMLVQWYLAVKGV